MSYTEITKQKLDDLLFDWEIDHQQSERGQFLAYDEDVKVRIAADNTTRDFRIEEFKSKEDAVNRLTRTEGPICDMHSFEIC